MSPPSSVGRAPASLRRVRAELGGELASLALFDAYAELGVGGLRAGELRLDALRVQLWRWLARRAHG